MVNGRFPICEKALISRKRFLVLALFTKKKNIFFIVLEGLNHHSNEDDTIKKWPPHYNYFSL